MARSRLFSILSKRNSTKKSRKVRGGQGSAADYGVKIWGYDQVADPNQGNVIKANPITGGAGAAAPYTPLSPPSMNEMVSTSDMSNQALQMQDASIKNMITPKTDANIQSDTVSPKTGGKRKTKRRGSKRKYGHKIKNGRRTKTIH